MLPQDTAALSQALSAFEAQICVSLLRRACGLLCCHGLAPAGIKASCGCCIASPPHWGGEENWKKKTKLMGPDQGSLTEQQRKQTVTTIILIRRKYKTNIDSKIRYEKPNSTMYIVKQLFFIAAPGTWGISPPNVRTRHPVASG